MHASVTLRDEYFRIKANRPLCHALKAYHAARNNVNEKVELRFQIRGNYAITVQYPVNMSMDEARRLAAAIMTLPIDYAEESVRTRTSCVDFLLDDARKAA